MRRALLFLLLIVLCACNRLVYVPVERRVETVVKEKDTVVLTKIEKEIVRTTVQDTIAYAETAYAEAKAQVADGQLDLVLQNKAENKIPVVTKVISKIVRDSIPYPVEVVVEKKVRYVSLFDRVVRWVGGVSFLILLVLVAYKIIKWRSGFL